MKLINLEKWNIASVGSRGEAYLGSITEGRGVPLLGELSQQSISKQASDNVLLYLEPTSVYLCSV